MTGALVMFALGLLAGGIAGYLLGLTRSLAAVADAKLDAQYFGVGYIVVRMDKKGHFEQVRLNPKQVFVVDEPVTTRDRFRR